MPREPSIWCPHCRWRPRAESRWVCTPGCGTAWHTFWTGGVCPGCMHRWRTTQCLACHVVSPHAAWYHHPDDAAPAGRTRREEPAGAEH